jgi:hypothetical protein
VFGDQFLKIENQFLETQISYLSLFNLLIGKIRYGGINKMQLMNDKRWLVKKLTNEFLRN